MKLLFDQYGRFFEKLMNREVRVTHRLLEKGNNSDSNYSCRFKNEAFLKLEKQVFWIQPLLLGILFGTWI